MEAPPAEARPGPEAQPGPEARAGPPFSDLRGRQPVRITAEDGNLVAYGFGDQRVEIPAGSVSEVVLYRGQSLILLDHRKHMLLKAPGNWNSGVLGAVCQRGGLPRPNMVLRYGSRTGRKHRRSQSQPRWQRAPGYCRLRVRPRGFAVGAVLLACLGLALTGAGLLLGAGPATLLPGSVGAVRNLLGVIGGAAGAAAGLWLFTACTRGALATVRWAAASRELGSVAPWSPFYPRGVNRGRREKVLTAAMVLGVASLAGWGPGVGIVSLVHGFSDQALVTQLRTNGVRAPGVVFGVPRYSEDSDGHTEVTYQPTLNFTADAQIIVTPDPAIGGRRWPIGDDVVTVVYDPAEPDRAAVAGQLRGSPWGGAPLGNLISGTLLTLALPVLAWRTARRIRDRRRATREGLLEGIW